MKLNALRRRRGGRTAPGRKFKRVWLKFGHRPARSKLCELLRPLKLMWPDIITPSLSGGDQEGEPVSLAQRRVTQWARPRTVYLSTPGKTMSWPTPASRTPEEHRFNMLAYGEDVKLPPEAPAGDVPSK